MKTPLYQDDILDICTDKHLTVDEIFSRLKKIHSSVWRATVYRNVEELVKSWKLNKITNIGTKSVFEKNKWFHMHIFDEKKQNLIDMNIDKLDIPLPKNFKVNNIELVVKWEFVEE